MRAFLSVGSLPTNPSKLSAVSISAVLLPFSTCMFVPLINPPGLRTPPPKLMRYFAPSIKSFISLIFLVPVFSICSTFEAPPIRATSSSHFDLFSSLLNSPRTFFASSLKFATPSLPNLSICLPMSVSALSKL